MGSARAGCKVSDAFPTLFCADGCSMVDRRMGIYGYPIEIQAFFFHGTENVLGSDHFWTFWAPREEDDEHWLEIKAATKGAMRPIPLIHMHKNHASVTIHHFYTSISTPYCHTHNLMHD